MITAFQSTAINQPLSVQLRAQTAGLHDHVESSDFLRRLLNGTLSREAVVEYHAQLWFIYETLEHAVTTASRSPIGARFADTRLERRHALESDLAVLTQSHWAQNVRVMPETARYVERIETNDSPGNELRILAHHYVRYLGDISGGQVIAHQLRRHYGFSANELKFYDFSGVGRIKPYRDAYRATLDILALDEYQRAELIDEAVAAFRCNCELLAALSRRFPARR